LYNVGSCPFLRGEIKEMILKVHDNPCLKSDIFKEDNISISLFGWVLVSTTEQCMFLLEAKFKLYEIGS